VPVSAKLHEFVLYLRYIGETKKSTLSVEEAFLGTFLHWTASIVVASLWQGYPRRAAVFVGQTCGEEGACNVKDA